MSLTNISEKLINFLTSNLNDCETLIKKVLVVEIQEIG